MTRRLRFGGSGAEPQRGAGERPATKSLAFFAQKQHFKEDNLLSWHGQKHYKR